MIDYSGRLLHVILRTMQSIVLLYMAMGEMDVFKVKMGSLIDYS